MHAPAAPFAGAVDEIAMRATRVLTRDGVAVFVPNSELITGRLINQSAPNAGYRVRIAIEIPFPQRDIHIRSEAAPPPPSAPPSPPAIASARPVE